MKNNDESIGILVCGHGSRNPLAVAEFAKLVNELRRRLPNFQVEFGYLEFARPVIREALDKLHGNSIKRVLAVPAMLFAAGHAKNDIPSVLKEYSAKTGLQIDYGRELGIDRLMIAAAGARIKDAIDSAPNVPLSDTLLVVVGRGSSDPDANSNVSKVTRMLVEGFGFGWGETLYSGVTFPLVKPGLEKLTKLGFKRIIVFPYFLFSGVLLTRIEQHTQDIASVNKGIEFIFANYLGDHPLVIDTFLNRIQGIIDGDTSMNCSLCKYRSNVLGFEKEVGLIQESHHNHVEANVPENKLKDVISRDQSATTKDYEIQNNHLDQEKNINNQELAPHSHSHSHHHPYPHADHPLGPSSLNDNASHKSEEN